MPRSYIFSLLDRSLPKLLGNLLACTMVSGVQLRSLGNLPSLRTIAAWYWLLAALRALRPLVSSFCYFFSSCVSLSSRSRFYFFRFFSHLIVAGISF